MLSSEPRSLSLSPARDSPSSIAELRPYNEGEDLKAQARAHRRRHGHYPKVICADQIYRTPANRAFCQRHGIRLSGPRLGRPKNDPELLAAEKRQFLDDQQQRNSVEGKIGQGKRRFGLGLIREKLACLRRDGSKTYT
jgi:hypothetical protein